MRKKYPHIDAYRTGQNIKRIMRLKGLTVQDIQTYLSLAVPQTIYRWFEGRNLPSVDNLYALSGLFCVPLDALIAGDREAQFGRQGYFHASRAPVTLCSYFHANKAPVTFCSDWEWQQDAFGPQEKAVNWEPISGWRECAAERRLIAYYRRLCMPLAG